MYKRKRLADKKVGGSKLAATDEECMFCLLTSHISLLHESLKLANFNNFTATELNNDDDKGDGTGKAVHQEYTCLAESLAIENLPFLKTSSM